MVQPFTALLLRRTDALLATSEQPPARPARAVPPLLLPERHVCLLVMFRGKVSNAIVADDLEKISVQWMLDQYYSGLPRRGGAAVTAIQLRFGLAKTLPLNSEWG